MKDLTNTISKVSKYFYENGKDIKITSGFWKSDPTYPNKFLPHVGYDYVASVGTRLVSPFGGEVVFVRKGLGSSYGRYVSIYNGTHTFHIAHLSRVDVSLGQKVSKGQLLGLSGASGASENTYAPHVHAGLAKGKMVDVGIKGDYAGHIWLNMEEFNFDSEDIDYWRNEGGVYELNTAVNERTQPNTSGTFVKTHPKGTKLNYVAWGNSPKYTWFKLANGNYIAYGERGVEVYGKDNPKAVSKPNVGKYANLKGATWLFVEARKDNTYPAPSVNKTTSLRERSVKILAEDNGRVKVNIPGFDPSTLWVANSQITVTDKPRY